MRLFQLYCDLDNVLADFELQLFRLYGMRVHTCTIPEMWEAIDKYDAGGGEWFYNLPLMADALELWNYIEHYDPMILTATGHNVDIAGAQKKKWAVKHLGVTEDRVIAVPKSEMKAAYATPNSILIDDNFPRSITPWTQAGGIGIIHSNARLTIEELRRLNL